MNIIDLAGVSQEILLRHTDSNKLCCKGCEYLSKEGCTIKCLACKLCFCKGTNDFHSISNKLYKLRRIAQKYDLYHPRTSKKDCGLRSD